VMLASIGSVAEGYVIDIPWDHPKR
jgi:hypothetical protein